MSSSPSSGCRSKTVTDSKDGKAGDEKPREKRKRSNGFQEDSKKKAKLSSNDSETTPISAPTSTVTGEFEESGGEKVSKMQSSASSSGCRSKIVTDGKDGKAGDEKPDGGELVPQRLNFSDEVIKVIIEKNDGEYVLKLKKTSYDNENNAMEEHAQTAGMLLSQAAMLRELGEILLSKIQTQMNLSFSRV